MKKLDKLTNGYQKSLKIRKLILQIDEMNFYYYYPNNSVVSIVVGGVEFFFVEAIPYYYLN